MLSRRGLLAAAGVGAVGGPGYMIVRETIDGYEAAIEDCENEYGEDGYVWVSANESERREIGGRFFIGDVHVCVDADSPRAGGAA